MAGRTSRGRPALEVRVRDVWSLLCTAVELRQTSSAIDAHVLPIDVVNVTWGSQLVGDR